MFSQFFDALEHSSDQVGGHEIHGEFVGVLVVAVPERVMLFNLWGDDRPEVLERLGFVVVGEETLPRVHVQSEFRTIAPWVLWLLFLTLGLKNTEKNYMDISWWNK